MAPENHGTRLNPNNMPAIISPIEMKDPMVICFQKVKKNLVRNTTVDNPVNKAKVSIAA